MKKRIILFLLIGLVIIFLIYLLIKVTKDEVKLTRNVTLEINTEVSVKDLINDLKIVNNDVIDTSVLGKKDIEFQYQKNKKELTGILKIEVIDSIKPSIEYVKELTTTVGNEIDLRKDVKVTDNSKENILVNIMGDYSFDKIGTYNLKYVCQDSSGNISEEEFSLKVLNNTNGYDYTKLEEPSNEKVFIGQTSKGYDMYTIDGSLYIEGILIVNKTYALGSDFVPMDTYTSSIGVTKECNTCINKVAYSAYQEMRNDALTLGLNVKLTSGYRPYNIQKIIYNNYKNKDGILKADTYSARPGHSEHQTGLAFDLNSINDTFTNTPEGKWVNDNCYKYGFIIRYPSGKESITGFKYESWHLRFVGTDLAFKLYNNGDWLTLEEYFGITSVYQG